MSIRSVLISIVAALGLLIASLFALISSGSVLSLPGGYIVDLSVMEHSMFGSQASAPDDKSLESRIALPDGFSIGLYATGLENPRLLLTTTRGDLLVSAPRAGKIYLLERGSQNNTRSDGVRVLLDDLDRPHGIDWHAGWLYIGEGDAITRVRFDPATRSVEGRPEAIISGLPNGGNHWTKTVHVGPDEQLYVAVGSSCNVCEESDPRRAALLRFALDGSQETIFATGLRNTVDFGWHPTEGAIYATDNGRDLLGDDFPPCEFNRIVEGGFYGWPYANAPKIPDPDYGDRAPEKVAMTIPPVHGFPAHTAPLGMTFYTGDAFPERYRNTAFVALHGSWNRSRKQGYAVHAVTVHPDGTSTAEPFVTGFEHDQKVIGRPVGIAMGIDGALYVSDDFTGSVYRIAYGESQTASMGAAASGTAQRKAPLAGISASQIEHAQAAGQLLFDENDCASCHLQSVGGAPPRILSDLAGRYDVESLARFLEVPQPPMPAYPFTDAERRVLAIYLLTRFGGP